MYFYNLFVISGIGRNAVVRVAYCIRASKKKAPLLVAPIQGSLWPNRSNLSLSQVHKSVFDRTIPKLVEILQTEDLPANRYTSAFIILNELASDEAEKSNKE